MPEWRVGDNIGGGRFLWQGEWGENSGCGCRLAAMFRSSGFASFAYRLQKTHPIEFSESPLKIPGRVVDY